MNDRLQLAANRVINESIAVVLDERRAHFEGTIAARQIVAIAAQADVLAAKLDIFTAALDELTTVVQDAATDTFGEVSTELTYLREAVERLTPAPMTSDDANDL